MKVLSKEKEFFYKLIEDGKDLRLSHRSLDKDGFHGRVITIDGKDFLYFADCSYLGLQNDPRLIEGAKEAAEKYGIILSNSRAFVSSPLYQELLTELSKILPGHAIITTTTTLGHCSVLPLVINKNDLIIMDIHAHNSIQMAAKICAHQGTDLKYLMHHNNMEKLDELVNHPNNEAYDRIWFLGDGIYSMQGEFIDLKGLKETLNRNDRLFAYLDDAHGFSWTGKHGRGFVLNDSNQLHEKMIVSLAMCKSFGSAGGIIVFPNSEMRDRIDTIGQTQIFSAPIPNPVLGAAIASAKLHQSEELKELHTELKTLIDYFKSQCEIRGIPVKTKSKTPIQFIEIGRKEQVYTVLEQLMEHGIYCSGAAYPSMPKNHGGLRISLTRHLEKEDIDRLLDVLTLVLEIDHSFIRKEKQLN